MARGIRLSHRIERRAVRFFDLHHTVRRGSQHRSTNHQSRTHKSRQQPQAGIKIENRALADIIPCK